MGGSSSKKYQASDYDLGTNEKTKLARVVTLYHGKGKPNSPSGEDDGLQEIWATWDFQKSSESIIIVPPKWMDHVGGYSDYWSNRAFEDIYDAKLRQFGITEDDFAAILDPLNALLRTFCPFQSDRTLDGQWLNKGRVQTDTATFVYAKELRKHLAAASQKFPQTEWKLQVHKQQNEGESSRFTEVIYHAIEIHLKIPKSSSEELSADGPADGGAAADGAAARLIAEYRYSGDPSTADEADGAEDCAVTEISESEGM